MAVPSRFIHVGINYGNGEAPIEALEKTFSTALDWMRYGNNCWLLYSNTELATWRDRIRNTPGISSSASFLLTEFSAGAYEGYQQKWAWEWISKHV